MKRSHLKLHFSSVDPQLIGTPENKGVDRVAVLSYDEVIAFLSENNKRNITDPMKYAAVNILGHKVTVNSLKLRTFATFEDKGEQCCASPDCQIKPAYFVLEKVRGKQLKPTSANTAYLSLYGVDSNGMEVEFTHDHTLARCFGGANALANTTMMCRPCNNKKSRIESKMHHRTLRVLKEYLEDATGQEAHPQFLLERVRQADFNFSLSTTYERAGVVPIDEVIKAIRSPQHQAASWHDRKVKVSGVRLNAFASTSNPCCQDPDCALPATHFAVERIAGKELHDERGYHLNMYGKKPDGSEIQFVHHHMFQQGVDGIPEAFAIITLCSECKEKTLDADNTFMADVLTSMGGVSRKDLEQEQNNRKSQKILDVAQKMRAIHGMDMEAFLAHCNAMGAQEKLANNLKAKHNVVRRVVQTLPALTPAGARWFRKRQRALFEDQTPNPQSPEFTNIMKQVDQLRQKHGCANKEEFLTLCNAKGAEGDQVVDHKLTPMVRKLDNMLPQLTTWGAQWMLHERNILKDDIKEQAAHHHAQHINAKRARKIKREFGVLAELHGYNDADFLMYLDQMAHTQNVENTISESMNSLRNVTLALNCSPRAGRVFLYMCGHILGIGPLSVNNNKDAYHVNELVKKIDQYRNGGQQHNEDKKERILTELQAYMPMPYLVPRKTTSLST